MAPNLFATLALGALLLTVSGCAETPVTKVQQASLTQIQKGVTTRDELMKMLGAPFFCQIKPDGGQAYAWRYAGAPSGGPAILLVNVSKDQTVQDFSLAKKSDAVDAVNTDN